MTEEFGVVDQLRWVKNHKFNNKILKTEELLLNWFKINGNFIFFSPIAPIRNPEITFKMIPIVEIENLSVSTFEKEILIYQNFSKKLFFVKIIKNLISDNKNSVKSEILKFGFFTEFARNHFTRIVCSLNFKNSIKNKPFFFPIFVLPFSLRSSACFYFWVLNSSSILQKVIIKSIICNYLFKQNQIDWSEYYPN